MEKIYSSFPVYLEKDRILKSLEEHQVIVVESPTGSGKTVGLPIILMNAGYSEKGMIGITQPRRIAALSVASFIRNQLDLEDNDYTVASKMRFFDQTTDETKLKIMTDGTLLEEVKTDPFFSKYSVLMIDEAHERSLNIDFILGLIKNSLLSRPDLRVIISSATINADEFSSFFDGAPIISVDGRMYPVEVKYNPVHIPKGIKNLEAQKILVKRIVDTVHKVINYTNGDILIFCSGEGIIKDVCYTLMKQPFYKELDLYPLYSRLSKEDQEKVFTPTQEGKIKVVVATNIAETSITINGISTVIDSGLGKIMVYNQNNFTSSLNEIKISKSNCDQRKGRAGRTKEGVCIRLYSKEDYEERQQFPSPQINLTDLSEVVLRMATLGIKDFENFPFITKVNRSSLLSAEQTLKDLDVLTKDRDLTKIGEFISKFPLEPRHGRILAESVFNYPDALNKVLIVLSFLSSKSPFVYPEEDVEEARAIHKNWVQKDGDIAAYLVIFNTFKKIESKEERLEWAREHYLDIESLSEIESVYEQLCDMLNEMGIPISDKNSDNKELFLCVAQGMKQFICKMCHWPEYRTAKGVGIYIHPGCLISPKERPQYIVAGELVSTGRLYAHSIATLSPKWIPLISQEVDSLFNRGRNYKELKRENKIQKKNSHFENIDIPKTVLFGSRTLVVQNRSTNPRVSAPLRGIRKDLKKIFSQDVTKIPEAIKVTLYLDQWILKPVCLRNVIEGIKLVALIKTDVIKSFKERKYYSEDEEQFIMALSDLFCLVPGRKGEAGIIGLDVLPDGAWFFKIFDNIFDAITITQWALMNIMDSNVSKKCKKTVYSILKGYEN